MIHRALYTMRIEDGAIVLEDRDLGRCVTNDAELVIQDLRDRGANFSMPVIYRDTSGRWDGLTVANARFAGFYGLNSPDSTDYREAKARLIVLKALRDKRVGDTTPCGPVSMED